VYGARHASQRQESGGRESHLSLRVEMVACLLRPAAAVAEKGTHISSMRGLVDHAAVVLIISASEAASAPSPPAHSAVPIAAAPTNPATTPTTNGAATRVATALTGRAGSGGALNERRMTYRDPSDGPNGFHCASRARSAADRRRRANIVRDGRAARSLFRVVWFDSRGRAHNWWRRTPVTERKERTERCILTNEGVVDAKNRVARRRSACVEPAPALQARRSSPLSGFSRFCTEKV
jgi:hypothetical protein